MAEWSSSSWVILSDSKLYGSIRRWPKRRKTWMYDAPVTWFLSPDVTLEYEYKEYFS